jgi:hypothetical protein
MDKLVPLLCHVAHQFQGIWRGDIKHSVELTLVISFSADAQASQPSLTVGSAQMAELAYRRESAQSHVGILVVVPTHGGVSSIRGLVSRRHLPPSTSILDCFGYLLFLTVASLDSAGIIMHH